MCWKWFYLAQISILAIVLLNKNLLYLAGHSFWSKNQELCSLYQWTYCRSDPTCYIRIVLHYHILHIGCTVENRRKEIRRQNNLHCVGFYLYKATCVSQSAWWQPECPQWKGTQAQPCVYVHLCERKRECFNTCVLVTHAVNLWSMLDSANVSNRSRMALARNCLLIS